MFAEKAGMKWKGSRNWRKRSVSIRRGSREKKKEVLAQGKRRFGICQIGWAGSVLFVNGLILANVSI
jgi:hypothetical protein